MSSILGVFVVASWWLCVSLFVLLFDSGRIYSGLAAFSALKSLYTLQLPLMYSSICVFVTMTSGSLPDILGGIAVHFILKVLSDMVMKNVSSLPIKKIPVISKLLKFMLSLFSET